jgi:hypothetical protein
MGNNAPCICGHGYNNHNNLYLYVYCSGCYQSKGEEVAYHDFKLDNLQYLERLYESRHE